MRLLWKLPTVTFGAGDVTAFGAFACDTAGLARVLEARAAFVEVRWLEDPLGSWKTHAVLLYFGPRGRGFIGRSLAGTGVVRPAADAVKDLGRIKDVLLVLIVPLEVVATRPEQLGLEQPPPPRTAVPPGGSRGSDPGNQQGGLTWDEVLPVVREQASRMRECFAPSSPQGAVSLDLLVGLDGKVSNVDVLSSTVRDGDHVRCILAAARALVFPRPRSARPLTLSLPFVF